MRSRCLGARTTHKKIEVEAHEHLLIAARQALDDPPTAEHLRRTRPRIERLLGLLAHGYTARQARYIGAARARFTGAWTAALVNLNPIGRRLTTEAG